MLQIKDLLLCLCLGFISLFVLFSSMVGGSDAGFLGVTALILISLVACGAYSLKHPNYIHFINLIAFLSPIVYILDEMKMGLSAFVIGVGAFLVGGGFRFMFTVISFYVSAKKKS